MTIPTLTMNTGHTIPMFGYGTYKVAPDNAQQCVETALSLGIRHIDTAQMYGNEKEVGYALAASGIDRDDLFITTKLNNGNHRPDDARRSFDQSLKDLQVDYVDLFLIHWPLPTLYDGDYVTTWKVMTEFEQDGRSRSVGVSNFQPNHLQTIIDATGKVPAVNQIEAHPYFANNAVRAFNEEHSIVTEAWSPLGRGTYFDDPTLVEQAKRLNKTPAQVMLRWAIDRGDVVFPKASSADRIKENMDIFDWSMDDQAMRALNTMDKGEEGRRGSHPDTMDVISS